MWMIFGAIGKVAETGAKAVGKKKDGPLAFFLFFLIIFLLLAFNTYKNNR